MQLKQLELVGGGALTVYLRDSCDRMPSAIDRPMVLVVPGGGYTHVSAREGDPVALQFAAAGYHTAVLDYAICEKARDYLPLRQLAQAIGLVREHAAAWHVLPDKIAVCGFSAGGHLALSSAVLDIPGAKTQPRPNAVIFGLSGGFGGEICPPRQLCTAGGHRRPGRPAGLWAGRQDHARDTAGVRLAYDGRRDGAGGEHPAAGERPAHSGRALRSTPV